MRVLRLGVDDGHLVDLHPALSLVRGLTARQRGALRHGFAAIGTGLAPARAGLLESHGLLLDAGQDDIDLLGIGATPVCAVVCLADVDGALPADESGRLRDADRHALRAAEARWQAVEELRAVEVGSPVTAPADPGRASLLRARIARHGALDPEPLRAALDVVRDHRRRGEADVGPLATAVAGVGLDVRDLGLPADEVVRLAEDWSDERHREAEWVVGATVELQALDDELAAPAPAPGGLEALQAGLRSATRAHADAVQLADDLRAQLLERHAPRPGPDALERHLLSLLSDHRSAHPGGAVPLLLDGVLGHLDAATVTQLLDRAAGLAGTVQLVVADDHPAALAWAESVGPRRAAVVEPIDTTAAMSSP